MLDATYRSVTNDKFCVDTLEKRSRRDLKDRTNGCCYLSPRFLPVRITYVHLFYFLRTMRQRNVNFNRVEFVGVDQRWQILRDSS